MHKEANGLLRKLISKLSVENSHCESGWELFCSSDCSVAYLDRPLGTRDGFILKNPFPPMGDSRNVVCGGLESLLRETFVKLDPHIIRFETIC